MITGKIYGYARVSTKGQSLKDQKAQLKAAGVPTENIFSEKISGAKSHRPALDELLKHLASGDCLVTTKLDRLGRSATAVVELINKLLAAGVTVNILQLGAPLTPDSNNAITKLMLQLLASFAEFERDLITERMQEGKAYARKHKKGFKEGRPRATLNLPRKKVYNDYLEYGATRAQKLNSGYIKSVKSVYNIRDLVRETATPEEVKNGFKL